MQGWISLHRKIFEWEWYKDTNIARLFIHLLLKANWEDKQWKGQVVKRGQFITGLHSLEEETGLSMQKLRTALNKLKSTKEIIVKSTNKFSLVTLVNYELYQGEEKNSTNKQQTNNKQITTTNNIITKQKNKKETPVFDETSNEYILTSLLVKKMLVNDDKAKIPEDINKWVEHIEKLMRLDKYTFDEVEGIINFSQENGFWKSQILSTSNLRKKAGTLKLQRESKKKYKENKKTLNRLEV